MNASVCRLCQEDVLYNVHTFRATPYGDLYKPIYEESIELPKHDLSLARCPACRLLQLKEITNLESQYRQYLYFTSVTNKLLSLYSRISKRLVNYLEVKETDYIVDIGSNDGSFLENFLPWTKNLIGIDPSEPACVEARNKGIVSINDYLTIEVARDYLGDFPKPKLIACNYTVANVANLNSFFSAVCELMSRQSLLNIVTGYHLDQFSINMFDYIGHDHLTYLTLHDFINISSKHDLRVVYCYRHEQKGGSIEIGIVKKDSEIETDDSVGQLLQREIWQQSKSDVLIYQMLRTISENAHQIQETVAAFSASGFKTVGIGASISSTALISEFRLEDLLENLYDDDPRKKDLYSPGLGIQVKPLNELPTNRSNLLVLVLAWQHTERILERLAQIAFSGYVLIPMPKPKLLFV